MSFVLLYCVNMVSVTSASRYHPRYQSRSSMYIRGLIRYSDNLLKKHKLHLCRLFSCNQTCYCVNMVSVTSASRYHPRYQSRSSMYIRGLIPRNFAE